jgi:hypothetical protein
MIVSAWNNGKHFESGAGYGFKLSIDDRNEYFSKEWSTVFVELPNSNAAIEISVAKPSFWNNTCRELISKEIGIWLRSKGLAPWTKGNPPKFELVQCGDRKFRVEYI